MRFGSLISLLPSLGTSYLLFKQTCVSRSDRHMACCSCVCSVRFMLAQIILYCFSLLKMFCIHPWFGICSCSLLKVLVVEHFISVTLHAEEIKKYIVKAMPIYVSNQLCSLVIWCGGTGEQRITKLSQSFVMLGNSGQGSEFMKTSVENSTSPLLFCYYELRTVCQGAIWKNSWKKVSSFSWIRSTDGGEAE